MLRTRERHWELENRTAIIHACATTFSVDLCFPWVNYDKDKLIKIAWYYFYLYLAAYLPIQINKSIFFFDDLTIDQTKRVLERACVCAWICISHRASFWIFVELSSPPHTQHLLHTGVRKCSIFCFGHRRRREHLSQRKREIGGRFFLFYCRINWKSYLKFRSLFTTYSPVHRPKLYAVPCSVTKIIKFSLVKLKIMKLALTGAGFFLPEKVLSCCSL